MDIKETLIEAINDGRLTLDGQIAKFELLGKTYQQQITKADLERYEKKQAEQLVRAEERISEIEAGLAELDDLKAKVNKLKVKKVKLV